MLSIPDELLAKEALDGDDTAFERIVRRHLDPVFQFIFRLTGKTAEAEDLTQETFVKVWKKLKKYNPEQRFKTWLFTIARNTAFDFLRKKKITAFSEIETEEENFSESLKDPLPTPDEIFKKAESAEMLHKALVKIPLKQRAVLLWHYADGLTFQEIGDQLGESVDTVKSRGRRGLLMMKKILGQ